MLAIAASDRVRPLDLSIGSWNSTRRQELSCRQKTPASFVHLLFGVGSFKFINAKGEGHYVRYQVVPDAGEQLLTDEEREKQSANYLMDEIKAEWQRSHWFRVMLKSLSTVTGSMILQSRGRTIGNEFFLAG